MNLTLLDHLLGLCLTLALPLVGAWQFRRLKARLAAGEPDARVRQYRLAVAEGVLLTGAVLSLWVGLGRPWELLAPTVPGAWGWLEAAGWAVAGLAVVLLVVQIVVIARDEEALDEARGHIDPLAAFLPHTRRELGVFRVLSLAAGIGEEVVFRGFAMAWLAAVSSSVAGLGPGGALAVAAVASSLIFGLAHAYQGPGGIVKTGAIGLVLAGLALATGGLLAPMLVHTVVDLTSGQLAYLALADQAGSEPEPATA
jgi:membrane protease YdiL (CAAX protease family)